MPKPSAHAAKLPPPPTPAARLLCGRVFQVTHKPDGVSSTVTAALQRIAKAARSQQPEAWAVFPVFGRDAVVVGFASAKTRARWRSPGPWSPAPSRRSTTT